MMHHRDARRDDIEPRAASQARRPETGDLMWRNVIVAIGIAAIGIAALSAGRASGSAVEPEASNAPAGQPTVTADDIPPDVHDDSWARLPLPRRDRMNADGQHVYDMVRHPDSRYADRLWGPVAMWLYSPQMLEHIFPASTYLRFGTEKDQRLTELTILATAREVRSQYEWSAHEPPALAAGLEPEIVAIVKQRTPLDEAGDVPGLGDVERTIIQFTREAVSAERVSAETFAHARELFGDQGVMDLTGLIGYYNFVNITLKAFDLQLEPGRERLLPNLW